MPILEPGSKTFRVWRYGLGFTLVYLLLGFLTSRLSGDPLSEHESLGRIVTADPTEVEDPWPVVWSGAMSVHSGRSHDAEGTLEEVAAGAREAGLSWVVLGDHPRDWTEEAGVWEPRRVDEVHLSMGAELLVAHVGRTLTLGLDSMPRLWESGLADLGATATRDEGFVSIVHARSPRWGESWKDPDVDGAHAFEAFDVSEMARKRLASIWAPYHLASAVTSLVADRSDETMIRFWRERSETPALNAYDSLRARGPLVMTGGLNHHPKIRTPLGLFPGYASAFRTVVNHLHVAGPIPTDPVQAEALLLETLRSGRLYISLGWSDLVKGFRFVALREPAASILHAGSVNTFVPGDRLRVDLPTRVGLRHPMLLRLLRDGEEVDWVRAGAGAAVEWEVQGPGVYRVEVFRAGIDLGPIRLGLTPWIFSNPIEFTR